MTWSSFFKLSPITCSKRTTNISLPSFQRFKGGKRTPRQPLCSVDEIRFQNVASKLTWQERHEFEPRRSLFRFVVFCFVLFCFCFIYSAHAQKQRRNNDRKKKYNSRFEEQCYQINIRKNYMVWLSFGLPNAKNCSKLRTVKIADHDCLLTVAYNLKTCRTMKLASD